MALNRREFLEFSSVTVAALSCGIGLQVQADAKPDPNAEALAALAASPYATSAMPGFFAPVVDATGGEHSK